MNEGRIETVNECFHAEAEWRWPPHGLADADVYRGVAEIGRAMAAWRDAWGEFRFEPQEYLEDDPFVFVVVAYLTTGRQSGLPLEQAVGHLWRVRDDLADRLWMFGDAAKARERFLAGDRPD
jgi:ketosteroid isomerase-like protein